MRPRLAFALLTFLALLALAVSLLDDESRLEAGYDLLVADSRVEMSFPVDTAPLAGLEAPAARLGDLPDDPWPRQELVDARRERRAALEELAAALDRARGVEAGRNEPRIGQ